MFTLPLSRLLAPLALALLSASTAAQHVFVVGPAAGPGVDFTDVSAAIDAAADGDVILVQPGDYYGGAQISDRGLTLMGIVGPQGERAQIENLVVSNVPAGRSVHLRGLRFGALQAPTLLHVLDCDGPVLLEDLVVQGLHPLIETTLRIERSAGVVLSRSAITGTPQWMASIQKPGITIVDSSVAIYDSTVTGGAGTDASMGFHGPLSFSVQGGPGVRATNSALLVAGGTVTGGRGGVGAKGTGPFTNCLSPAGGGNGAELTGVVLRRLDAVLQGGLGGTSAAGCGEPDAAPGQDLVLDPGSAVSVIPEFLRTLAISSPIEQGGTCSIEIHGQPGEPVLLLQALLPSVTFHAGLKGMLAGAPPYVGYSLGVLDATGTLAFTAGIPANVLPPGIEGVVVIDQLLTAAASGGGLLSSPSMLVLVDALP